MALGVALIRAPGLVAGAVAFVPLVIGLVVVTSDVLG
jgi:hypothetical protein